MFIEIACPNEECPNFYDPKNVQQLDYNKSPNTFICTQCKQKQIPKSEIPNPYKQNYRSLKDYSNPNEQFKASTVRSAEDWAKTLQIKVEDFRIEVLDGQYKEWFEKSN